MAKLFIVGTPIGNLGDLSPRAKETLRAADVIACEDTRHSRPLLAEIGADAWTIAYHKFNEAECALKIVDLVRQGKNVALITDAGMPSVSDPGAEVVALCRREGIDVESVPGPSAVVTAVALSGVKGKGFVFLGCDLTEADGSNGNAVYFARSSGSADYYDNVVFVDCTVGEHLSSQGWYSSPVPNPSAATATAGWREYGLVRNGAPFASTSAYCHALTADEAAAYADRTTIFRSCPKGTEWLVE